MIGYDNLPINHQILLDLPFREGVGVITRDVAKPHHQDVDLIDTPTWESLVSGLGVISLNGTSEYLELAALSCADLNFMAGDYSLGCWFYVESGGEDDKTLMARFLVDNDGWELYHYPTNTSLTLRHHHAGTIVGDHPRTGAYSLNWIYDTWHFMGVSRDGASATFYRNGVAIPTTITAGGLVNPETCAQKLFIGTEPTFTNDFLGKLWRPRIWGRALSADEWAQIFSMERHWFGV